MSLQLRSQVVNHVERPEHIVGSVRIKTKADQAFLNQLQRAELVDTASTKFFCLATKPSFVQRLR